MLHILTKVMSYFIVHSMNVVSGFKSMIHLDLKQGEVKVVRNDM